ncbi:hypothetical protein KRMM14A1259_16130 [Krasilnikovia sp. MM14-A1259]
MVSSIAEIISHTSRQLANYRPQTCVAGSEQGANVCGLQDRRVRVALGRRLDAERGVVASLPSATIHRKKWRTPANQPRAVFGEVVSRRVDEPASEVVPAGLDRPDAGGFAGNPAGERAERLAVRGERVAGKAVSTERHAPNCR